MKAFSIRLPEKIVSYLDEWSRQRSQTRGRLISVLLERDIQAAIESGEYVPKTKEPTEQEVGAQCVMDYLFGELNGQKKPGNRDILNFCEKHNYEMDEVLALIKARSRKRVTG